MPAPDICTLVLGVRTLLACIPGPVCSTEPENGKIFCRPGVAADCNKTILTYQCRREDGSTYDFTKEE